MGISPADILRIGSNRADAVYHGANLVWTPFQPSDIAGLGAWFDASAITGKADTDPISQWDDLSGNGRHLTQGTGANQPAYRTNVQGGLPAVRFDGTNDLLSSNAVGALFSGTNTYTMIIACRSIGTATGYIASAGSSTSSTFKSLGVSSTPVYRLAARDGAGGVADLALTGATATTPVVLTGRRGALAVDVRGLGRTNRQDSALSSAWNGTTDRFALGALQRGTAAAWTNCDIYEVIIYTTDLSHDDQQAVEHYLHDKWKIGSIVAPDAATTTAWLIDSYRLADQKLVDAADIASASELREQDGIVYDPDDPNLATNPERLWKFYCTALTPTERIYVSFSPNGLTGWTAPQICTMGSPNRKSEDPSIVTMLNDRGRVHRDGSGKMHMYVEDKDLAPGHPIAVYESTDGITWTYMTGNPVIPIGGSGTFDEFLTGSPIARHDGTQYIVAYEGIDATAPTPWEGMGIACGVAPNALTKSANNPVWTASADPHAVRSIVADAFELNDAGTKIVFLCHSGQDDGVTNFRGATTVTDPTLWEDGDIASIGGNISQFRNDVTFDHSAGTLDRVVTAPSDDQRMIRLRLWGV